MASEMAEMEVIPIVSSYWNERVKIDVCTTTKYKLMIGARRRASCTKKQSIFENWV